jgi:nucleoside-diphosphate-sugar epimerase
VRASWGQTFEVYARDNVLATQRVLEACLGAGVSRVVYASSSVYGDQDELPLREDMTPRPKSPYGVTKLAGEHLALLYARNFGLHTVSLRFFTVYGPRQRLDMAFNKFIRAMMEGREIPMYGDGGQTRDFTFIDDIVGGFVRAPAAPAGSLMNISGGNCVTLTEAIRTLEEVTGLTARIDRRPEEAGDVRDTLADVGRIQAYLDFRPGTAPASGHRAEYEWLAGSLAG